VRQEWFELAQLFRWNPPMALPLASAAIGSIITLPWISAKDARGRKRQRHDTALEVALSLEGHALEMSDDDAQGRLGSSGADPFN
jgi:hypothetical protein